MRTMVGRRSTLQHASTLCSFDVEVLAWVGRTFLTGVRPRVRHDGIPFETSGYEGDRWPALQAGTTLRMRVAIIQARGDWAWMKQALGLCGWKGEGPEKNMCWRCKANVDNFRDVSQRASWRGTSYTHADFLARELQHGRPLARIFSIYLALSWLSSPQT